MDVSIVKQIGKRRRQMLVSRVLYYCWDSPMIDDHLYDKWNRELETLEQQYPRESQLAKYFEISPSKTVGSDDLFNYPIEIVRTAEMLRDYKGKRG